MKLENWVIKIAYTNKSAQLNDFLSTPCQLAGNIYGNSAVTDGYYYTTSIVIKIEDGIATTCSGQLYELGTPLFNFKDYLKIKEAKDAFKLQPKT